MGWVNVRHTGVNGCIPQTGLMLPHGLWGRSHDDMLAQVVELGFNSIRLPFSNAMLHSSESSIPSTHAWNWIDTDPIDGLDHRDRR